MKKVNVKKEILIVLLIVVAMFAISTTVLATSTGPVTLNINTTPSQTDGNTQNTQNTQQNTQVVQPTQIVVPTQNQVTNTNGSTYQNTALPQTGDASDYAIFAVIFVAAIVAVYAYKKVRDYNI